MLTLNVLIYICFFFFFNDTATTEIYTLSLHDALPICVGVAQFVIGHREIRIDRNLAFQFVNTPVDVRPEDGDRKSTRLNSSHANISYAVFCLKKKKKNE